MRNAGDAAGALRRHPRRPSTRGLRSALCGLLLATVLWPRADAAASVAISSAHLSPRNRSRPVRSATRFIILHTTEGGFRGALEKLSRNGECHYLVNTDGTIHRIIDRRRVAFHCGRSMWNGTTDLDAVSIGIEIVGYHDRDLTAAQYRALRALLDDLKRSFRVPDERILTHSMVAYGTPNRWQPRSHRGRKRCAMLLALPANRRRLGLSARPAFDPDLRAGRLVDADPELTRLLYSHDTTPATPQAAPGTSPDTIGPGRSAWDIARDLYNAETTVYVFPDGRRLTGREVTNWRAMPPGTRVVVGTSTNENPPEGLLALGADGATVADIAGDETLSEATFYFVPGRAPLRGSELTSEQVEELPQGTRVLVGYRMGGPISGQRPAFAVCGVRWNRPDTFYRTPRGELIPGDAVDERSIPNGTLVFYRQ